MGVSGSGKTTVGKLLAERLTIDFFDGDDFHSEKNVKKMASGSPLNDSDRENWLDAINTKAKEIIEKNKSAVFACSALKKAYRIILEKDLSFKVLWIYLKGDFDFIHQRISERKGHFMPPNLLKSQFETLEEPINGIVVNLESPPDEIISFIMNKLNTTEFGLVGLGVMGKSLARNLAKNGVKLSLYNRHVAGIEENIANKFIEQHSELEHAFGFEDLEKFVNTIQHPRKIFLMIKAGLETDIFIDQIKLFLEKGDILIDGGNSHYNDTKRRMDSLLKDGIHFIGTGVSGGEKGALEGPSIMPSGDFEAYKKISNYLNIIAAKDKNGESCCTYIGPEGSGHFIKMVHNGIEYAEMQLIAETFAILRYGKGLEPTEISSLFKSWSNEELKSYLLEITAEILLKKEGDQALIDLILDKAGNKGTGNWTTVAGTELGVPVTMITSALFARYLSSIKTDCLGINHHSEVASIDFNASENEIKAAYQLARILNHQQGFCLIKTASDHFNWNLNLSEIARIWTNGCIIRSVLMEKLTERFKNSTDIFENIDFIKEMISSKSALKNVCKSSLEKELPIPSHLAAIDYLNVLNNNFPTANIIQAQRDFFGAHTYQRVDDSSGKFYHTVWE